MLSGRRSTSSCSALHTRLDEICSSSSFPRPNKYQTFSAALRDLPCSSYIICTLLLYNPSDSVQLSSPYISQHLLTNKTVLIWFFFPGCSRRVYIIFAFAIQLESVPSLHFLLYQALYLLLPIGFAARPMSRRSLPLSSLSSPIISPSISFSHESHHLSHIHCTLLEVARSLSEFGVVG